MNKPALVRRIEHRMRKNRFRLLRALLDPLERPIRILDVGGELGFWEILDYARLGELHITLMNVFLQKNLPPNFHARLGDARDLQDYSPRDFDVVMSNSVIGHVGGWAEQKKMAAEIRRVGTRYFVQTPNHYFPVDWRTLLPFFHFLPLTLRARLLQALPIAPGGRIKPYAAAVGWAGRVRNLTPREVRTLFPEATIVPERVLGFTKSFMLFHGFTAGWSAIRKGRRQQSDRGRQTGPAAAGPAGH